MEFRIQETTFAIKEYEDFKKYYIEKQHGYISVFVDKITFIIETQQFRMIDSIIIDEKTIINITFYLDLNLNFISDIYNDLTGEYIKITPLYSESNFDTYNRIKNELKNYFKTIKNNQPKLLLINKNNII